MNNELTMIPVLESLLIETGLFFNLTKLTPPMSKPVILPENPTNTAINKYGVIGSEM